MSWTSKEIREVCELFYGKSLPDAQRTDGEYPVYGSAGIVGYHNKYIVEGPGIIIGRKGSVGTVYYSKQNFFPIDTVYFVVPNKSVDLRFLYYKLLTLNLSHLNTDAAVPGLNRNVVHEQISHYPDMPTQKRIARILSAYDDLIENNLKRIKLLEEAVLYKCKMISTGSILSTKEINDYGIVITGKTPSTSDPNEYSDGLEPSVRTLRATHSEK